MMVGCASLVEALSRLDRRLAEACGRAQQLWGNAPGADPYRGLYISPHDVDVLLACPPGRSPLSDTEWDAAEWDDLIQWPALTRLGDAYDLPAFDRAVILLALAPEVDLRYERLYAYLQDDVTRRRAGVDLILNLLCGSAETKLGARARFGADSPLLRQALIHLLSDGASAPPSLLAHAVKLDDQIVRLLLEQDGLDARLAPACRVTTPRTSISGLPLESAVREALARLVVDSRRQAQPLRLCFRSPSAALRSQAAEAIAGDLDARLLVADAGGLAEPDVLRALFREARFRDFVVFCDHAETVPAGWTELASSHPGGVILGGRQGGRSPVPGFFEVVLPLPGFTRRRECWQAALTAGRQSLDAVHVDALAARFRLDPEQIEQAAATVRSRARWRGAAQPAAEDYYAAARSLSGHDLAGLARKIEPWYGWDDIVLPGPTVAQLREICSRVEQGHRVLGDWGFDRKFSMGKGVTALFAGPSGVGKTMAAEVIARDLQLDLYKIDLAGVVSKYIGETEKNLDRLFTAAESANAILLFDEADALFGKRSEVRDSHDRYANIEISYLLQKMEAYEGIAILATNLRQNLDEAFARRLAFHVHFPFPDAADRRRIWQAVWPTEKPLEGDLDWDFLAARFKLNGGNIRNAVLAAAFLAAAEGRLVSMRHLLQGVEREYQKMGKSLGAADFGPYGEVRA